MPVLALVAALYISEQLFVIVRRIFLGSEPYAIEVHVIRMSDHEYHASVSGDPVEFSLPDVDVLFTKHYEEGKILGERIGKFYIPSREAVLTDPEGKDRSHTLWLGFEGVRIEG